ncbi:hypothetical protein QLX67_12360, partial [Balneolaceae bacterium ANBcel3]|nr:hypothetical protein [Balneolaceae bacterium ANBcel3]
MYRFKPGIIFVFTRFLLLSFFFFLFFFSELSIAQSYENIFRSDKYPWYQLETPHFIILYQQGQAASAYETARILEEQYPIVQNLTGGELKRMPVVLNSLNDRSNGYVTTLHFRIEIEIPKIHGKSMNPRDGNWLHTVVPHELVHA